MLSQRRRPHSHSISRYKYKLPQMGRFRLGETRGTSTVVDEVWGVNRRLVLYRVNDGLAFFEKANEDGMVIQHNIAAHHKLVQRAR
ncbi:hypothetical protein ACHAWU_007059 [Discostella pseudostelligera]|uniref:Uncharacterized protein n=1 Tax=Discostella pseudostelligera TaxID=259834 RepID=A0ABD3MGG8_9STRA